MNETAPPPSLEGHAPYRSDVQFSPYRVFTREEWARLREDTPMTLVPRDLEQLSGLIEELAMAEVEQIYLPLSRLLNLHVAGAQELHAITNRFLGRHCIAGVIHRDLMAGFGKSDRDRSADAS